MADAIRGPLALLLALLALGVMALHPTAWLPAIGLALASMLISPPP